MSSTDLIQGTVRSAFKERPRGGFQQPGEAGTYREDTEAERGTAAWPQACSQGAAGPEPPGG